ncbi:MAG: hypothetical protein ACFBSG_14935 [Leptolyngbyaceae cyanobacterium]
MTNPFHFWPRRQTTERSLPSERSPQDILNQMSPELRAQLMPHQRHEVERLIALALPRPPVPKLVDLRLNIDLLIGRFFLVLYVGKEQRRMPRQRPDSPGTAMLNWLAAVILIVGVNFTFCLSLILMAYLVKSALNINLLPGHFRGFGN